MREDYRDLGVGIGLRSQHYRDILAHCPTVGFFEILSDNYLFTQGRPLYFLDQIAERYPIAMHGVSLSIGSTDPLDFDYLARLKALAQRTAARSISDHLCWTGVGGTRVHDLLPIPYNDETLKHVASRVRTVQDFLGSRILLENPSTYLELRASSMPEQDFLCALALEADCGILLDVNNVYVNAFNHELEPEDYFAAIPFERVGQLHVAGHTHEGTHIVDTHKGPVIEPVWQLLESVCARTGACSTLLEWDTDIPAFERVQQEAALAAIHRERGITRSHGRHGLQPA